VAAAGRNTGKDICNSDTQATTASCATRRRENDAWEWL
jgi:hypothetical protein